MLGRKHHIGGAKEGIGPGGIDPHLLPGHGEGKVHLRAFAAANPVPLLDLDLLDEVHMIQPVQKLLGVGGDLQHPLGFHLADHRRAAALAYAVHHFLIGQAALAGGTPVDGHLRLVGQAVLVQLEEDPLGPLEIRGVGGVHLPGIVKGETDFLQLLPEVVDIFLGHLGGMHLVLDGIIFRGQAEGVPADGEQHVVALHAALAADNVHGGIGPGMAHMQPRPGGIRELDQPIKLGLAVIRFRLKGMGLRPDFLPLLFNGCGVVILLVHGRFLLLDPKKRFAFLQRRNAVSRYHFACPGRPGPPSAVLYRAHPSVLPERSRASGATSPCRLAPSGGSLQGKSGPAFPFIARSLMGIIARLPPVVNPPPPGLLRLLFSVSHTSAGASSQPRHGLEAPGAGGANMPHCFHGISAAHLRISRKKPSANAKGFFLVRRHPDSNWRIKVLQTFALPLGYGAVCGAVDGIRTRDIHLGKVALYH